ncbi:MAG: ATP-binding cassette domain-containing protein, partial [Patescibacteria group bacterium]
TVHEVIRSGRTARLSLFGRMNTEDELAIKRATHQMGIEFLLDRPISKLSGGERQKVLLTRALVGEPKILFLDEPVDGLDPTSRADFYALLRTLNKDGLTIILVSHDVHSVAEEANSAICLKHQLVCHGNKACLIGADELKDLFHKDRKEILQHHDT